MPTPIRVLIVEDSEDDALLLVAELRDAGYEPEFERVDTPETMVEALNTKAWDVVVCDYSMPRFSATAALSLLQWRGLDLPLVIVSGTIPEDVAIAAMKSGVRDYVLKGSRARLVPAIEREIREAAQRHKGLEEQARIRSAFGHYLHPAIVQMLSEDPSRLRLGVEKRDLTVLFADLRGFTALAEALSADLLADLLNEFLGAMTEVIFAHAGLLDKYIGDGLMAFWGAPLPAPDHAARACRTALDMIRKHRDLQWEWQERGLPPLEMGIAINTGSMLVGNLGSPQRFTYTAVGDHVNLGARLEELNKLYGTRILVSEYTHAQIGEEFLLRDIDLVRVRGRRQPVRVFELLARAHEPAQPLPFVEDFAKALGAYRNREWRAAFARFSRLATAHPDDGPTRAYMARCRLLVDHPLPSDWDGVSDVSGDTTVISLSKLPAAIGR